MSTGSARRIAFRAAGPASLHVTAPTRIALMWWDGGEPVFVEPPPGSPAGTVGCTVVAVWPSREVFAWSVTESQLARLVELHTRWPWPLDRFDACVYPDGDIAARLESMRAVPGFTDEVAGEVARLIARLEGA